MAQWGWGGWRGSQSSVSSSSSSTLPSHCKTSHSDENKWNHEAETHPTSSRELSQIQTGFSLVHLRQNWPTSFTDRSSVMNVHLMYNINYCWRLKGNHVLLHVWHCGTNRSQWMIKTFQLQNTPGERCGREPRQISTTSWFLPSLVFLSLAVMKTCLA